MNSRFPDGHVFLVAEADGQIGFGHLAEIRAIRQMLPASSCRAFALGAFVAAFADVEWLPAISQMIEMIRSGRPEVVVWSLRRDSWKPLWPRIAAASNARHVWIADTDDDCPPVDLLIAPALQSAAAESKRGVLRGPRYFPIERRNIPEFVPFHARRRDVLLTLGGADRSRATPRLLPALGNVASTVVIGPGFAHAPRVRELAAKHGVAVIENQDGLLPLLAEHRMVISAGGNTLYEAAVTGTPALVAWEDPHEQRQGEAFASAGAARVVGRGVDIEPEQMKQAIAGFLRIDEWQRAAEAARRLIDGRGAARIAEAVEQLAGRPAEARILL